MQARDAEHSDAPDQGGWRNPHNDEISAARFDWEFHGDQGPFSSLSRATGLVYRDTPRMVTDSVPLEAPAAPPGSIGDQDPFSWPSRAIASKSFFIAIIAIKKIFIAIKSLVRLRFSLRSRPSAYSAPTSRGLLSALPLPECSPCRAAHAGSCRPL